MKNYIKRASKDGVAFECQKCGKTTNPDVGQIVVHPYDESFLQEFCLKCSNAIEAAGFIKDGSTSEWGFRHG